MSKLVGVMPLWDEEKKSIWMLPGYLEGLKLAGLDAFIFPLTTDSEELRRLMDLCDGFLLTGGQDAEPALYGERAVNDSVDWCAARDRMDEVVIHEALQQGKGILGICRGLQILNVILGGTLYQDLPTQHPSEIDHHMTAPYDRRCHDVDVLPDTPLQDLLQQDRIPVNSIHHQAVRELAPALRPMAVSTDGLTEAAWMPGQPFVWAVQWHPECWFRTDENSRKIFQCFAEHL